MRAKLPETEGLLRAEVLKWLEGEHAGAREASGPDGSALWAGLAEMGCLAAPLPESFGGVGGGVADAALVLEPLGRRRLITPYVETVGFAGFLIETLVADPVRSELLSKIASGDVRIAVAYLEAGAGFCSDVRQTTAHPDGDDWTITGEKTVVRWADVADYLLVTARCEAGAGLFLIPRSAPGVVIKSYPTNEGATAAEVRFDDVSVSGAQCLGVGQRAAAAFDHALDAAAALVCAEALGAMATCLDLTLDYLKVRTQFGAKLSSFQALQHRLVDLHALCEMAEGVTLDALAALKPAIPPEERSRRVSAAKAFVGKAGRRVGLEAIQLHGGIGMTRDYPLGSYLARLTMIDMSYGDHAFHLNRFMRLSERMEAAR